MLRYRLWFIIIVFFCVAVSGNIDWTFANNNCTDIYRRDVHSLDETTTCLSSPPSCDASFIPIGSKLKENFLISTADRNRQRSHRQMKIHRSNQMNDKRRGLTVKLKFHGITHLFIDLLISIDSGHRRSGGRRCCCAGGSSGGCLIWIWYSAEYQWSGLKCISTSYDSDYGWNNPTRRKTMT